MKKQLIGLVCFILSSTLFAGVEIRLTNPVYGDIQKTFTEPAKTQLSKVYDINMPLSGEVERIKLEEGSPVSKSQILARLIQLPWKKEQQKAQSSSHIAQINYRQKKRNLQRAKKLRKRGFITQSNLENIELQLQATLSELKQSKANLELANYNLSQSVLRSPINGIVLKRFSQGGQWLSVGTSLLELGDFSDLNVIADVLSQEAQQLHVGDSVSLSNEGNTTVLHGKVKRIDPAGFTKQSALGVEEQHVNVIVTINLTDKTKIGVGYRLQTTFYVGQLKKHVLLIPRFSILQDSKNHFYVFKIVNKKLKKQIIKVGVTTDYKAEVLDGLSVKDTIVAAPNTDMKEGMKL